MTTPIIPDVNGTPVVHQVWAIDGGSIVFEIRTDKPLPATAFATVGDVVASLEHLAETLAPPAPLGGIGAEVKDVHKVTPDGEPLDAGRPCES